MRFEAEPMLQDIDNNERFGGMRKRTKTVLAFEADWARLQSDIPGWPEDPIDREFHDALLGWLKFHGAMLIGELVPQSLHYLQNNPACEELTAFDHIIVDEYQDLNKAEQVLLDQLGLYAAKVIVGDEDQSIYKFRHAHPPGIAECSSVHPETDDVNLVECHRCPTLIVEMANYLIKYNHKPGGGTRLQPAIGKSRGDVHIIQWTSLEEEALGLAGFVENLITTGGYRPAEILILSPRRLIGYGIREGSNGVTSLHSAILSRPE